jgi:hypothetical protein
LAASDYQEVKIEKEFELVEDEHREERPYVVFAIVYCVFGNHCPRCLV